MAESMVAEGPLELEELVNDPWNYIFCRYQTRYFISVACGRGAVFARNIELNDEELADYNRDGNEALKTLARTVFDNPQNFDDRHIASLQKWPLKRLESR